MSLRTTASLASILLCVGGTCGCYDLVPGPQAFEAADGAQPSDKDTGADPADGGLDAAGVAPDVPAVDAQPADGAEAGGREPGPCGAGSPCPAPLDPCHEAKCVAGKCVETFKGLNKPCDNADPCTTGVCDAQEQCVADPGSDICQCHTSADCAGKEDGDVCNGTLYCNLTAFPYKCTVNPASVVSCPPSSGPCKSSACDPKTGACSVVPVPDTKPPKTCSDGNPCTASDHCEGGECAVGVNTCKCVEDADCASAEDGDLCNGTLYCDLSSSPAQCVVNPATVKTCPSADASACSALVCAPKTGQCAPKMAPNQSPCEDGNLCTQGDVCEQGKCTPGTDLCFCKADADCAPFEDGDLCNGTLYCEKTTGLCKTNPKTVVSCAPGPESACLKVVCQPKTGQCKPQYAQKFTWCDADSNPCTVDDTCDGAGKCLQGTNTCVCETNADCAAKEDGDLCNGTLYCDKTQSPPACAVNPATVVVCNQQGDTPCKKNTCKPSSGLCAPVVVADLVACSDGDPCTAGDICKGGACQAGPDLCACKADADCLDDGDLCNGVPWCDTSGDKPVCKTNPKTVVSCDQKNDQGCLKASCQPKTGVCLPLPDDDACDDNNPCTVDVCDQKGACSTQQLPAGTACGAGAVCHQGACLPVAPDMRLVPASEAQMGCNAALDNDCGADEKPQHPVTLKGFFIDRFEVTAAQYADCVQAGNCLAPSSSDPMCNYGVAVKQQHPINCIDLTAAKAYCQHAGKRLPTEAEWEKAARGGCEHWGPGCASLTPKYPWGLPVANCTMTVMAGANKPGCDLGGTRQVGTFANDASVYGVRDMGGNVSEWVADGYAQDWYGKSPAKDPIGPSGAAQQVVRGGHIGSDAGGVRAGKRRAYAAQTQSSAIGVRCAKDL